MSFTSAEFFIFLSACFFLYYLFPSIKAQNWIIAIASYIFYGSWDWRFLALLFSISAANYGCALIISQTQNRRVRDATLGAAIGIGLIALGFFKYFNFFVQSLTEVAGILGLSLHPASLNIILPLGISFMTFQGMAYVIDVWRGTHSAERDLVTFLAFKAFFPQLVAGPIERAGNLLDQFNRPRSLDAEKVARAVWLLALGYFMKMFSADSLAPIVDSFFSPQQPFGWSVVIGTLAFGVQIYADFCGYSLIAKGAALLFGFELIWNFRFPYWATSVPDFWRRWHISLSTWLRDYLYIPLGGSRHGEWNTVRNLMITMMLGGLWHGASWNFVLWGALHGTALGLWRLLSIRQEPKSSGGRIAGWAVTMLIVFLGWFLFRATSSELLLGMLSALQNWEWAPAHSAALTALIVAATPIAVIEALQRHYDQDYLHLALPRPAACALLGTIAFLCLVMSRQQQVSFVYFQF